MSGYTKAELKEMVKRGDTIMFLANEVLTLRELAGEARKDARRVVEEIESLQKQVETAKGEGIDAAIEVVRFAIDWEDAIDKLQALKNRNANDD